MQVREADGVADLRGAIAVHNRAWRVGFRGIASEEVIEGALRSADDRGLEAFEAELPEDDRWILVAERDGAVVGFVRSRYGETADFVDAWDSEIVDLVVDPAQWRQGVGTALLDATVERTLDTVKGIWIAVLVENERARSFLDAQGFEFEETIDATVGGESLEHAAHRLDLKS